MRPPCRPFVPLSLFTFHFSLVTFYRAAAPPRRGKTLHLSPFFSLPLFALAAYTLIQELRVCTTPIATALPEAPHDNIPPHPLPRFGDRPRRRRLPLPPSRLRHQLRRLRRRQHLQLLLLQQPVERLRTGRAAHDEPHHGARRVDCGECVLSLQQRRNADQNPPSRLERCEKGGERRQVPVLPLFARRQRRLLLHDERRETVSALRTGFDRCVELHLFLQRRLHGQNDGDGFGLLPVGRENRGDDGHLPFGGNVQVQRDDQ